MLQLLRPNFSNLPCLYLTFHLEYPLVLSRFCFENSERDWRVPDATDMPWHVKYEGRLPLRDVYIKVSSSYCIN